MQTSKTEQVCNLQGRVFLKTYIKQMPTATSSDLPMSVSVSRLESKASVTHCRKRSLNALGHKKSPSLLTSSGSPQYLGLSNVSPA